MQKKDDLTNIFLGVKGKATRECERYALVFDEASQQFIFGVRKKGSEK